MSQIVGPARKISVIITTYNWPDALRAVLLSLNEQLGNFEVLIADDGSMPETASMLEQLGQELRYPWRHVWQKDQGFRAAKIRNVAAREASGDYLVFLDGDCIPSRCFIMRHAALAEKGYWVTGNRILLSETYTSVVLAERINLSVQSFFFWLQRRFWKDCNRLLPLLKLPLGLLRKNKPKQWRGAKTCNLGVWKDDFDAIQGFNEAYEGWGYEDSDLVIRLIKHGVYRKNGRYAIPVFHCWHLENDRTHEAENLHRLEAIEKDLV